MESLKVLLVDDEPDMLNLMSGMLKRLGFMVTTATNGREALALFEPGLFDMVVSDVMMPGMDGIELLDRLKAMAPELPVIMASAFSDVETSVKAMKLGAYDFVTKPMSLEELEVRVSNALEKAKLSSEVRELRERSSKPLRKGDVIIGTSLPIKALHQQIQMIAKTDVSVAISGESGTGKELVARTLHHFSPRKAQPFIVVNCGAIPENLLENELFGHVKGAYTGANTTHHGLLQRADGGTVFFDEIGELSLAMQVKLLRALQEHAFQMVGGTDTIKVDIRVLSATNKDLDAAKEDGSFRKDLFYRINVLPIKLPPLRERMDDIPLLANHFFNLYREKLNGNLEGLAKSAMEKLCQYSWPGNIRELENRMQQAMVTATGKLIHQEDIWIRAEQKQELDYSRGFKELKREVVCSFEKQYVSEMLRNHGGNISKAARQSGQDRKNFWVLMQKYGIDANDFK